MTIRLAAWHSSVPGSVLGGSLYAVAPASRLSAAAALTADGCGVHVDMIVGASGVNTGVTLDELRRVRTEQPNARIDVHLIATDGLGDAARATIGAILPRLHGLGVLRVAVADGIRAAFADEVAALRAAGMHLWVELAPHESGDHLDRATVDGALVMFIRPGSTEKADPRVLDRIPPLAQRMPVGVDGGITSELALACVDAGATSVVSGRALLRRATTSQPPHPPREQENRP